MLDLQKNSGASEIHIIAHSLGNDVLTRAFRSIGKERLASAECRFREVCLTAPDIDRQVFVEQIAPIMTNNVQHVTLYASSKDQALSLSGGIRKYARAGSAGDDLVVLRGIDTVDVSQLDTGFLSHAYYGDHVLVVTDLFLIFENRLPPKKRGLIEKQKSGLAYWVFSK